MRTRAILGGIVASVTVLVVGWQVGLPQLAPNTPTSQSLPRAPSTPNASTSTSSSEASGSTTSSSTAAPAPAPVASSPADGSYTGSSVGTRFGAVQVAVTISGGSIIDVAAVHLTDADGRSIQISNRAAPILRDEVLASQSARVSTVGGATYTSDAYLSSLQSALDQAGM